MGGDGQDTDLDALMELALNDPAPAVTAADQLLSGELQADQRVIALRARGLARRQLGTFDESEADLIEALTLAEALGDGNMHAKVGLTLAGTWVWMGRVAEAQDLLEECVERSEGAAHVESLYQLGTLHIQARDFGRAEAVYDQALPLIRELGQRVWEANLIGNRGAMRLHQGRYDESIADLDVAIDLCRRFSSPSWTALYMNNKAYALQLRGDIPESLDLYAEADAFHDLHGLPKMMFSHKCSAHLAAGMYEETMALAQQAHGFHNAGNSAVGAIEALLAGGAAALALDDYSLANQLATAAIALDTEDAFPVWAANARLIELEARFRSGTVTAADPAIAVELFELARDGETTTAARALLVGAAVAQQLGDLDQANRLLDSAADVAASAPLHVQIERWKLVAEVCAESGDREAALEAAQAGLALFDQLVSGVADYNVRYKAGRHAEVLAEQALAVLIEQARLREAIDVVEHVRAGAMRLDDRTRAADTARSETRAGESYLVWIEHADRLLCVVDDGEQITLHDLAATAAIAGLVERHAFAHRQLARRSSLSATARAALADDAQQADHELATALLPDELAGSVTVDPGVVNPVIINPSPLLAEVVWAALPGLAERPHSVAPSIEIAHRPLPSSLTAAVVFGASELPHVADEIADVGAIWQTHAHLDPDPAQLHAVDQAHVLHVAGHFVNETRNPLFSAVPLGDWQLRGNEYLQLAAPPSITVVSACSSAHGSDVAGAHVGFASAALAAGTATVIVTNTLVEDGTTIANAMTELHTQLRDGVAPAHALRTIRANGQPEDRSALAAISVVGTGW